MDVVSAADTVHRTPVTTSASSASELVQGVEPGPKPSIRERLDDVLNKPRERLEIEAEPEKEREVESEKEIDREVDRDRGLSH